VRSRESLEVKMKYIFKNKIFFSMYTKLEILEIFNSVKSFDELEKVGDTFKWLIDNNFMERNIFLHHAAMQAFRRIVQY
jgi:hypothetical protein